MRRSPEAVASLACVALLLASTPPAALGAEGVTEEFVVEAAQDLDLPPEHRSIVPRLTNDTPTARWVARRAKELLEVPSGEAMERMKNGCILRTPRTLRISDAGEECGPEEEGCRRIVARSFQWLSSVRDLGEFRELLTAMKPNEINSHVEEYSERQLSDAPFVLSKNYFLDFSLFGIGFKTPVRNVQYFAASGPGYLVFRERNTAPDRYVEDFNGLSIYLSTRDGIVNTNLTIVEYSGRFRSIDRFGWLNQRAMKRALEARSIVRQYVLDPGAGKQVALQRGRRDFEEVQSQRYCSEPLGP